MEILTSVKRLYIRFMSLVNDFVYSFGRSALLLLVEVQNHTVPVRERCRIRDNILKLLMNLTFLESEWFIKYDEVERGRYLRTCQQISTDMSVDPAAFPIRLQSILMKEDINVYTFVYRRMQEVKTLRNKSKIYHILADDPIKYIYIFFLPRVPVIWQSSQLSATIILHLGPLSYDFVS